MKISIITATYNSERTLKDTMKSVLFQTYPDIEYIVVDGASKDGTTGIIKEIEPQFHGRMRYISEPDKGIYDAMNKGIGMATGDVVGILNSDDLLFDEHIIADIVHTFMEYQVDCVYGDLVFVKANDISSVVRSWIGSQYHKKDFFKGWAPAHPTFYVKKKCYDTYGVYDISMKVSADFDLMMRFLAKYKIKNKYMRRNFVKMRYGGESTGSIKNIYKGNKTVQKAFKKNGIEMSKFYFVRRLVPKFWNMMRNRVIHKSALIYE